MSAVVLGKKGGEWKVGPVHDHVGPGSCGGGVAGWPSTDVTENGVWRLAAQRPVRRQGWWKGKFALFRRADSNPKTDFPPLTTARQELL